MMKWKEEFIKPAINFIENAKGNVGIVFGHDCDSIASASIIFRLLKNLRKEPSLILSKYNFEVDEKTIENCKNFENVIIVDIGDTPEERINNLAKEVKTLIIDHHLPKNYICEYVNPRIFRKNVYMPVSYVCWLIYRKFLDEKEILWIAGFGTLGDFGAKENKDLFIKIRKFNRKLIDNLKIEDRILIEKSVLGKITRMIDSCRIAGGFEGIIYAAKVVSNSKSYENILKDKKINTYFKIVEKEFKEELLKIKKKAIKIGEFLIYELKSKYNLKSSLASYLPKIYKNEIIFIAQKNKDGFFEVSIRRGINRKDNLSKIVEIIAKNTSAKGGGHPTAAGMRIDRLEELIDFIKKQKGGKLLS